MKAKNDQNGWNSPSWLKMVLSRLPELRMGPPFHAKLPTLPLWPFMVLTLHSAVESQS